MADQEVIKHTKKVYKIWNSKNQSFGHKLKEFLLEIFIIVFAVSLSIWLHGLSEHKHEQEAVKKFLLGLREDLKQDIKEMQGDKKAYILQGNFYECITSKEFFSTSSDSTYNKYREALSMNAGFVPNNGRYEGFKSSGKIGNIENDSLQNYIVDFYQEDVPNLLHSTDNYVLRKSKLSDYILKNRKGINSPQSNLKLILKNDEPQNISYSLKNINEVLNRYDKCIKKLIK
jgi:hypothetical protein